jgi:hypothetical protein
MHMRMEIYPSSAVAANFNSKNLTGGSAAAFCPAVEVPSVGTPALLASTTPSRFFQP